MSLLLGLVPLGLAAVGWVLLERLNRRTGWFRRGEIIFWDVILLILITLMWLRWF